MNTSGSSPGVTTKPKPRTLTVSVPSSDAARAALRGSPPPRARSSCSRAPPCSRCACAGEAAGAGSLCWKRSPESRAISPCSVELGQEQQNFFVARALDAEAPADLGCVQRARVALSQGLEDPRFGSWRFLWSLRTRWSCERVSRARRPWGGWVHGAGLRGHAHEERSRRCTERCARPKATARHR